MHFLANHFAPNLAADDFIATTSAAAGEKVQGWVITAK